MDSKRLPGKPLLEKNGKTLVEHVYERASQIRCLDASPYILSDSQQLLQTIPLEKNAVCTPKLDNGTLRCAWFADIEQDINDDDIIINIQVDEVDFIPEIIGDKLYKYIKKNWILATFAYNKTREYNNEDEVKVDTNEEGFATYFSRQPIFGAIHIGIYVYRVFALKEYVNIYKYTRNECKKENLEQMIFFNTEHRFAVCDHTKPTLSINTQDDYDEWLRR